MTDAKEKLMEVATDLRDTANAIEEDEGFCKLVDDYRHIAYEIDLIIEQLEEI